MFRDYIAALTIIVIAIFLPISKSQSDDDLAIGGNFSVRYDTLPGPCFNLSSSYVVATNKSLYEGRWYFVYSGFSKDQVARLTCCSWDSFYDQEGRLHDFLYMFENNEYMVVNTLLTPISAKDGTYSLTANLPANLDTRVTLFYMDAEMFVFWEVVCIEGGKTHYRNSAIGFRSLDLVKEKKDQLERVMKKLRSFGGDVTLNTIKHDKNCKYPPLRKNPFL